MSLTAVEEAPKIRVLSVFGTRPEAAKMCPLVRRSTGKCWTRFFIFSALSRITIWIL